uniref:Uncharacterized protein n=1 Tax=Arundo donax TaxID=35708 RepID=A0A0A9DWP8_ARUDO
MLHTINRIYFRNLTKNVNQIHKKLSIYHFYKLDREHYFPAQPTETRMISFYFHKILFPKPKSMSPE